MIMEYEIRRGHEKGLPLIKRRSPHRSHSKDRSKPVQSRYTTESFDRRQPFDRTIMSEKTESPCETSIFESQESIEIDTSVLRKIRVSIYRNIPANKASTDRLERDIISPEEVVVKRRDGEGSKPIFDRETLKRATNKFEENVKSSGNGAKSIFESEELIRSTSKFEEIEEHRTVFRNSEPSVLRSSESKRRSVTVSPLRKRSLSPRRTLYRDSRDRNNSRGRSRKRKERYKNESRDRSPVCNTDSHSRQRQSRHYSRGRSPERDQRNWDRDTARSKAGRSYRDYRQESKDRSRERRERERSRERRLLLPHYIEQVPVAVCCGLHVPRESLLDPVGSLHSSNLTPLDTYRGDPPPRFCAYVLME